MVVLSAFHEKGNREKEWKLKRIFSKRKYNLLTSVFICRMEILTKKMYLDSKIVFRHLTLITCEYIVQWKERNAGW